MHTHTQAQLHFPFLCLAAAKPLWHCTIRCQETEATLRDLLLLSLQLAEAWGCKISVPVQVKIVWMTDTQKEMQQRGKLFAFYTALGNCFFLITASLCIAYDL